MGPRVVTILAAMWLAIGCSGGEGEGGDGGSESGGDARSDAGSSDGAAGDARGGGDADVADATSTDSGHPDGGDGGGDADGSDADDGSPNPTAAECFEGVVDPASDIFIDYETFGPVVGTHCYGTDHQAIEGVERVVFVGDSVTAGSPPTLPGSTYRALLARRLASYFGLRPPNLLWDTVDPFDGSAVLRRSGDFWCCAEWGARTDDLMRDGSQILDCFPESERDKTTLVVMTVGGNDIASITQDGIDGVPVDTIWEDVYEYVGLLDDAVAYLRDPAVFPGGVYVAFTNNFEFTDGTGDVTACPAAGLAGFGAEWDDPDALAEMVIWATEQYMSIAVDHAVDLVFTLESFCGHGFNHDNPDAPCYRGPGTERWFDLSCIHPNPAGHAQIADMFMAVVEE